MEEAHRIHKEVAWGWMALMPPLIRAARDAIVASLPPRGRVVTPWSLRARNDWSA